MTSIGIAGASLAGVRNSRRIAQKGFDGVITLVGDEADLLRTTGPALEVGTDEWAESAETLAFHPSPGTRTTGSTSASASVRCPLDPQRGLLRTTLSEIEFDDS